MPTDADARDYMTVMEYMPVISLLIFGDFMPTDADSRERDRSKSALPV